MCEVDSERVAAMGVCQSGGYPLLLNAIRPEIKANLVIYGGTKTPVDVIERCTAPILGIFGEGDHTMSIQTVNAFRNTVHSLNKSYEFTLYPTVPHGWLNDTMPGRYRQREAEAVWAQIIAFLEKVYAGYFPPNRVRWSWQAEVASDYDFSTKVRIA